ncbi:hypothetical protein C9374_009784 [Naegleria lovaniensis]|uniref:Uncharacterized protein n=1 Tax=Naegleria lovaniensis TaxID=51637 RepID=A0AA88H5L5_NAELO|nr:uncharacterized protein C9374_009784 [Naegleria lovaniensis]KAG2393207.1 hypothetical protein C9374_009784 [Naegleria lovaniensis]
MYSPNTPQYLHDLSMQHHDDPKLHYCMNSPIRSSSSSLRTSFHPSLHHPMKTPPRTPSSSLKQPSRSTTSRAREMIASTLTTMLLFSPSQLHDDDNKFGNTSLYDENTTKNTTPIQRSLFEEFNECIVDPMMPHSSFTSPMKTTQPSSTLMDVSKESSLIEKKRMLRLFFERTLLVLVAVLLFPLKMVAHLKNKISSQENRSMDHEMAQHGEDSLNFNNLVQECNWNESKLQQEDSILLNSERDDLRSNKDMNEQQKRLEALECTVKTLTTQLENVMHEKKLVEEQLDALLTSLKQLDLNCKKESHTNSTEIFTTQLIDNCHEFSSGKENVHDESEFAAPDNSQSATSSTDSIIPNLTNTTFPNRSQIQFDMIFTLFICPIILVLFFSFILD